MSVRFQNLFGGSGNVLTWVLRAVFLALIIGIATNVLIEQLATTSPSQPDRSVWPALLSFFGILIGGAAANRAPGAGLTPGADPPPGSQKTDFYVIASAAERREGTSPAAPGG